MCFVAQQFWFTGGYLDQGGSRNWCICGFKGWLWLVGSLAFGQGFREKMGLLQISIPYIHGWVWFVFPSLRPRYLHLLLPLSTFRTYKFYCSIFFHILVLV